MSVVATHPLSYAGDPFLPVDTAAPGNRWKAALCTLLSVILFALVVWLNYLRAIRWAGLMTAEAFGYMLGGVIFNPLLGLLGVYLVQKVRRKKTQPASKALGVAAIALFLSVIGLAGETTDRREGITDAYHKVGNLLKEAAGKQPRSANANWWDEPTRDFFSDILQMNQQYAAEVAALDRSAIKDLYTSKSYGGDVHMQKVITQLRAIQAVDEKYSSLEPIIKKMEDRVAAANVSEGEKQEFLKAMRGGMEQKLGVRRDLLRKEQDWVKNSIGLYDFAIAHLADYSIQDNKIYFRNDAAKREFFSEQTKAIALHNDFLKAKRAMEESRKGDMNQLGVSSSDLTPAQLGKSK
jgi:hypothetical protein